MIRRVIENKTTIRERGISDIGHTYSIVDEEITETKSIFGLTYYRLITSMVHTNKTFPKLKIVNVNEKDSDPIGFNKGGNY